MPSCLGLGPVRGACTFPAGLLWAAIACKPLKTAHIVRRSRSVRQDRLRTPLHFLSTGVAEWGQSSARWLALLSAGACENWPKGPTFPPQQSLDLKVDRGRRPERWMRCAVHWRRPACTFRRKDASVRPSTRLLSNPSGRSSSPRSRARRARIFQPELDRRFNPSSRSSAITARRMGSSRSAKCCRSPRRTTTSRESSEVRRRAARPSVRTSASRSQSGVKATRHAI